MNNKRKMKKKKKKKQRGYDQALQTQEEVQWKTTGQF
jgi:hypothetical protein